MNINETLRLHADWLNSGGTRGNKANLSGASLSGAKLSGANLSGADLSGANLSGAKLYRANLYGASLYEANLSGARLSGANLSEASLSGADLSGANLSGADLHGFIPLYADTNRRYVLYVIEANQPMFIAGCRCFTLTEAIEHWGRINPNPPYIKAISDYMETRKST